MPKAERTILSTRPLPAALLLEAAAGGFEVNCLSFIDTEPVTDATLAGRIRQLATEKQQVIFTSMNAVEAVADLLTDKPGWTAWCIGYTTKRLLEEKIGIPVAGEAPDAAQLAKKIIAAAIPSAVFFCGDQRRDTLPAELRDAGIGLEEQVVYRTIATPQRVGTAYDAALFFSPSAVGSFAASNHFSPASVYFAIGGTTARALEAAGAGQVVTAKEPGKEELLRLAMHYFRNLTTT